jgi:hypothetical protein
MHTKNINIRPSFQAKIFKIILGLSILCFAGMANAESIGRTNLTLDSDQWTLLTAYEGKLVFDQGWSTEPLYTKVFQIAGENGDPIALLMITSTAQPSHTNVRWISEICPDARDKYYAEDFGSNRQHWVRNCLIVNSAFAPFKFFAPDDKVLQALDAKGLHLFSSGYSMRTVFGASDGVLLRANLMTTKKFKGLIDAKVNAEQLYGVPPELIAWAEELHKRVKSSAQSMSGKLQIPPINFAD